MKYIAGVLIIVSVIIGGTPSSGRAEWREFIPRLVYPGADLNVSASYSSTDTTAGISAKTKDFIATEKLTLHTTGFVYDPRFILLGLSLGIGLRQEYQSSTPFGPTGWATGEAKDYRFDLVLLDKHPYTLNLYAYRSEPLLVGINVEPPRAQTGKGAIFRYRRKPYFFTTRYTTTSYETSSGTTSADTFLTSATYYKQYAGGNTLSFYGDYTHRTFSTPTMPGGTSNGYVLGNSTNFVPVSLNSSITESDFDQGTSTGSIKSSAFTWTESLSASLPLNFWASVGWNYQKNTSTTENSTAPTSKLSGSGKAISFSLTHRLYKSLNSYYSFSHNSITSPSGDAKDTQHALTFDYAKTIPWGTLQSSLTLQRSTNENSGETQIVNEPHPAVSVPGFFTLSQLEPDPATVKVYVKSPFDPFELILLEEGIDYIMIPVNETLQINVINLPPHEPPFILPGSFDFFVSYSVKAAEFKIRTDSLTYNISFNLLNDLLHPYYIYTTTSSKTVSGALPGGAPPFESNSNTVGLLVNKSPFEVSLQYQNVDSNVSSNTSWRGQIDYNESVTDSVRVFASAAYSVTDYRNRTSTGSVQPFTQKTATLSGSIIKRFYEKRLTLTGGASFSYLKSLTTSTAYGLNSSLLWLVGKFSLSTGANVYFTESEGENTRHARTLHQFYYLNMTRKIF
jgi:hypothetical protein